MSSKTHLLRSQLKKLAGVVAVAAMLAAVAAAPGFLSGHDSVALANHAVECVRWAATMPTIMTPISGAHWRPLEGISTSAEGIFAALRARQAQRLRLRDH
jgi:hypothetical protein